ncbi:MAG: CTP synthase [Patescibacteria group bacterium UBA2163]
MTDSRSRKKRSGTAPSKKQSPGKKPHKYLFVIGGVMSGVGKGIATSSIALILQSKGYRVNTVKVDPYLNVDAGTMNPTEHGEVFVLESGLETDQDMGNYERFLNKPLGAHDYMTSGMVYSSVIERERNLEYGGKCVEAIPHVRDEIMERYRAAGEKNGSDISVIEVGGTVGDFQNELFIEAARALKVAHPEDVGFMLVSYLPIPGTLGEMKTRPTQNAVHQLNSYGVQADAIIARSNLPLDARRKQKIAASSNVPVDHIISAPDIKSIYEVPVNFEKEKVGSVVLDILNLKSRKPADLTEWKKFVRKVKEAPTEVRIGIIGKYFDTGDFVLSDAYLSVIEALKFSAAATGAKLTIDWLNAKEFEQKGKRLTSLNRYDGLLVPGGFGKTGIEGKLRAIKYARENNIPYFGLCYGMQLLVIEYARNVLGLRDAHSVEVDPKTPHPVVDVMPEQKELLQKKHYGGTMRLGSYPAKIKENTIASNAYFEKSKTKNKKSEITERHRHRYEVNPEYVTQLEKAGLVFSGTSPDGVLMEIAELSKKDHPFMLGAQFHPEFQARPLSPHPLFTAFLKAALTQKKGT